MVFLTLSGLVNAAPTVDLEEGMEYDDAKTKLLDSGWQVVSIHVDEDSELVCYRDVEDLNDCEGFGIDDCSGTSVGYCAMTFPDGGKTYLNIVTEGAPPPSVLVSSWSETTEKPEISVHQEEN